VQELLHFAFICGAGGNVDLFCEGFKEVYARKNEKTGFTLGQLFLSLQ
jgi:hypothetical protein